MLKRNLCEQLHLILWANVGLYRGLVILCIVSGAAAVYRGLPWLGTFPNSPPLHTHYFSRSKLLVWVCASFKIPSHTTGNFLGPCPKKINAASPVHIQAPKGSSPPCCCWTSLAPASAEGKGQEGHHLWYEIWCSNQSITSMPGDWPCCPFRAFEGSVKKELLITWSLESAYLPDGLFALCCTAMQLNNEVSWIPGC